MTTDKCNPVRQHAVSVRLFSVFLIRAHRCYRWLKFLAFALCQNREGHPGVCLQIPALPLERATSRASGAIIAFSLLFPSMRFRVCEKMHNWLPSVSRRWGGKRKNAKNTGFLTIPASQTPMGTWSVVGTGGQLYRNPWAHSDCYFALHRPLQTTTLPFSALCGDVWGEKYSP